MTKDFHKTKTKASDFPDVDALSLNAKDLPDEQWADIPMLDGIAKISNKGRIKRLEREVENNGISGNYLLDEKIMTLRIHNFFNQHLQEFTYYLIGRVQVGTKVNYISISRMVYYCFVQPFDFNDKAILVIPKDLDGFNMNPDNLVKVSYREFQERIKANNRREPDFWTKNKQGKPFYVIGQQSHKIEISQYDLEGHLLATFPSIVAASKSLNLSQSSIWYGLNEGLTGHGFIWRKGKVPTIDIKGIKKALNRKRGPTVSQYNLVGKRVCTFEYADEAAAFAHRDINTIKLACRVKTKICAGYLWRFGNAIRLDKDEIRMALNTSQWKMISCYNINGFKIATYQGVGVASKATGLNQNKISMHAKRSDLLLNGMIWRFGDDPVINKDSFKDAIEYTNKDWPTEITQYTTNGERIAIYPSVETASQTLGIIAKHIHNAASGYSLTAGGFFWQRGSGKAQIHFP